MIRSKTVGLVWHKLLVRLWTEGALLGEALVSEVGVMTSLF